MNFSINPLTFRSMKIATPTEQSKFMEQLAQLLNQITTTLGTVPANLTALLSPATQDLGAITSQSFNTNGALITSVKFSFSTAMTLTFTNLAIGSVVFIRANNTAGVARILNLAGTTPTGTVYSILCNEYNNSFSMVTTGLSFPAGSNFMFMGVTMNATGGPLLNLIAQ